MKGVFQDCMETVTLYVMLPDDKICLKNFKQQKQKAGVSLWLPINSTQVV